MRLEAQGGDLQEEEEKWEPEKSRLQLISDICHEEEEGQGAAIHQGDKQTMKPI